MLRRALIVALLLVTVSAGVQRAATREVTVARSPLSELPLAIAGWQGHPSAPFDDDIVATLGVDEYINRWYERDGVPISLYVGYYASQRSGDTIHSPQNCLPGAGWVPTDIARQQLSVGNDSVVVTRYEIAKGLKRQVVLYWYQGRGRVISGEYAQKAWLMFDAARYGRSDGGLVRLISPIITSPEDAVRDISAFAVALLPHLQDSLP
jgi:EpsI family protein